MLAKRVTSAVTGKYIMSQTQDWSPLGMYLSRCIDARAAWTQSCADMKTRGLRGRALRPWMAKLDSRDVQ